MSFPPPPLSSIDWNNLSLTVTDQVAGHVESRYDARTKVWSSPVFVEDPYLRVHGLAPGLNYGQQVYEGLKAYRNPDENIILFRPGDHAVRMSTSASFVSIPEISKQHFLDCVHLAVYKNAAYVPPHASQGALYVRPLAFGSSAHLSLSPSSEYVFVVYVHPFSTYMGTTAVDAVILEDFDRAAPRGTGAAKVGGNYAPVMPWSEKAKAEGYGITLHLDSKTRSEVEEFSAAGFMGIKVREAGRPSDKAVTLVVPDSQNVIKSVTSESCVQIARSLGWDIEIRTVPYAELSTFQEVIAVGSAVAVLPIRSITCHSAGDKFLYNTGPYANSLGKHLKDIQQGKAKDTFGWCQIVTGASGAAEKKNE